MKPARGEEESRVSTALISDSVGIRTAHSELPAAAGFSSSVGVRTGRSEELQCDVIGLDDSVGVRTSFDQVLTSRVSRSGVGEWSNYKGAAVLFLLRLDLTASYYPCPSSAVELNTTSALANYATEAGNKYRTRKGHSHSHGKRLENKFGLTTLCPPNRDQNLNLPVIGGLVYCESIALDHAATEAGVCDANSEFVSSETGLGCFHLMMPTFFGATGMNNKSCDDAATIHESVCRYFYRSQSTKNG
uniref:Uncharacterized protein n=1 Tax=Timema poppense TaxID=170557 RepID=A0A7R9CXJ9_TIMPO|nr:unnamed protein product [Timema poppensis]